MKSLLRFQLLLFQEFLFEGEQRFRKGNSTGFHARDTAGIHCYGSRTNCALYLIKPRIISLTRADPLFFLPTASLRSHLLQFSILPFVRRPPLSLSLALNFHPRGRAKTGRFTRLSPHTRRSSTFFSRKNYPRSFVFPRRIIHL